MNDNGMHMSTPFSGVYSFNMKQDPLVKIPMEKWSDIQEVLKQDLPRSIVGYSLIQTQMIWKKEGHHFEYSIYCPFGNPEFGMVGINAQDYLYELTIQCADSDTSKLEEALKTTETVDWSKPGLKIACVPPHVAEVAHRLADHVGRKVTTVDTDRFVLDDNRPLFDVTIPPELNFKLVTSLQYAELIDSNWPHRFPGSVKYSELFIKAGASYDVFLNEDLISWMAVNEYGFLLNLFTLDGHRRKGYAELVTKLICNKLKRDHRCAFCFVVKGNHGSYKLFDQKLQFKNTGIATWFFFE